MKRKGKTAPVVIALLVTLYAAGLCVLGLWALGTFGGSGGFLVTLFLVLYIVTGVAVAVGVLLAMRERLREIDGGEEDEAKKY